MYGLGNNGQNLSANVPLIQQTSKSNCGPTSALQALYAIGDQGEVPGQTQYLSYYGGHASGHYIAIREVDKMKKTIRLMDCNWNNDYFGEHVVSVTEVYESISKEASRYLISLTR